MNSLVVSDHEVTQGEYEKYCYYPMSSTTPNSTYGKGELYPVYFVSWFDALVYCNLRTINDTSLGSTEEERLAKCAYTIDGKKHPKDWPSIPKNTVSGIDKYSGPKSTSYPAAWDNVICDFSAEGWRLPTRVEWEWLARECDLTNTQHLYSGTNDTSGYVDYAVCKTDKAEEVKTKLPNSKQLYDMSGNVAEICWDWWDNNITGSTPIIGADSSSFGTRTTCGGNYTATGIDALWIHNTASTYPYDRSNTKGFRVVRTTEYYWP